jgi:hypothetical protein
MFDKLNSIWKNLLFAFVVYVSIAGLIFFNFYNKSSARPEFTIAVKIAAGLCLLLALHGLFLFVMTILNINKKKYWKALFFLITSIVIYTLLYSAFISLILTIVGPAIGNGNRSNFRISKNCKQIDTNKIKATVEKFRKGIYPSTIDNNLKNELLYDTLLLPKQITKIQCGCRKSDTTEIVIRIWDIEKNTFELELINEAGNWKFKSLSEGYFED